MIAFDPPQRTNGYSMEALAEGVEPTHISPNPALGLRGIRMIS